MEASGLMNNRLFSVLYMFLLTLFFTSLVTVTKVVNEERIKSNQQSKLQRVILRVLQVPFPGDMGDDVQSLFKKRVRVRELEGRTVYTALAQNGKTVIGHATTLYGPGFWGPVYAMVGVDDNVTKIIGIEFYKHLETPGLGARISEPWFEEQFIGLPLDGRKAGDAFFAFTFPGQGKIAGELDAITGATFTTKAVETFLNRELVFLKQLAKNND